MKVKVEAFSEDWEEVKKAALVTIHKKSAGSVISSEWKDAMCLGRHSPIREFRIKILIEDIPRWIADQLVRHTVGVNNFMGTGRSDRGNKPREEQRMSDLTVFKQSYNADSFISFCNTRLCVGSVSKQTRELVEQIVGILRETEPEIAKYCVPPCISRGYCKEVGLMKLAGREPCNFLRKYLSATEISTFPEVRFESYINYRGFYESTKNRS